MGQPVMLISRPDIRTSWLLDVRQTAPMYIPAMAISPEVSVLRGSGSALPRIIDQVRADHQPVYLARRGQRVAAVIDADDLERILALAEDIGETSSRLNALAPTWRRRARLPSLGTRSRPNSASSEFSARDDLRRQLSRRTRSGSYASWTPRRGDGYRPRSIYWHRIRVRRRPSSSSADAVNGGYEPATTALSTRFETRS